MMIDETLILTVTGFTAKPNKESLTGRSHEPFVHLDDVWVSDLGHNTEFAKNGVVAFQAARCLHGLLSITQST